MVFFMMAFIAVFCLALYEFGVTTNKMTRFQEEVKSAKHFAQEGVEFFAQEIFKGHLNRSNNLLEQLKNHLGKKMQFAEKEGWFQLDSVQQVQDDYLIRVTGGIYITSASLSQRDFPNLIDYAYAEAHLYTEQYEALIGPNYFKSIALISSVLQSRDELAPNNYPDPVSMLTSSSNNVRTESQNITSTQDPVTTDSLLDKITELTSTHNTQTIQAFSKGFGSPTSIMSQKDFDATFPLENNMRKIPTGRYNLSSFALNLNSPAAFGGPDTFSYMKFKDFNITQKNQKVRFYPGIYVFERFSLLQDQSVAFLDTTTGPVIFIITRELRINGNSSSLLVFKDRDYTDKNFKNLDFKKYENKVDLAGKGKENPLSYPGLSGRKIAQIILQDPQTVEINLSGSDQIIGALSVGRGGGPSIELPSGISSFDGSEVEELDGKFGGCFDPKSAEKAPTTGHFQILGISKVKININSLSRRITLIGVVVLPGSAGQDPTEGSAKTQSSSTTTTWHWSRWWHHRYWYRRNTQSSDGLLGVSGNEHNFYGVYITNQINFIGNSCSLYLDSRSYPFSPEPRPGSTYIKYMRKVEEFYPHSPPKESSPL